MTTQRRWWWRLAAVACVGVISVEFGWWLLVDVVKLGLDYIVFKYKRPEAATVNCD